MQRVLERKNCRDLIIIFKLVDLAILEEIAFIRECHEMF